MHRSNIIFQNLIKLRPLVLRNEENPIWRMNQFISKNRIPRISSHLVHIHVLTVQRHSICTVASQVFLQYLQFCMPWIFVGKHINKGSNEFNFKQIHF